MTDQIYKTDALIAQDIEVLIDEVGFSSSFREAPEIDGIIRVPELLVPGQFATVKVIEATGTDLVAVIP